MQVIVPELVPMEPEVISQVLPDVTAAVNGIVVVPVMEKLKVVEPASFETSRLDGVIDSTGGAACVTVTSTGLLVAPVAVTRIVAVRDEVLVFAWKLQLMVPESVPLAPEVIVSQLLVDVTAALQGIVPVPVLETPNVVVPDVLLTFWFEGVTERYGVELPIAKSCLISSSESARL